MILTGPTISHLYPQLLYELLSHGSKVSPRGLKTREVLGLSLHLEDLLANVLVDRVRGLNYRFMVAEWLWILLGQNDVGTVAKFNSKITQFSDDGKTFFGAYGPPWVDQLPHVLKSLRSDPTSRQAVISLWRPNPPETKDTPCTLSLQFLLRDGKLNCVATMRSSDAWLGIPYDVFNFCQLTNYVAGLLEVGHGWFQLNLGSSHLYEENWAQANDLVQAGVSGVMWSPPLTWLVPPGVSDVFLTGETQDLIEEPWLRYAAALQAKTSEQALAFLTL